MGMPGKPDHTQEKLPDQTATSMDISYYMQKANFLPQIVFEILNFKKLRNVTGPEHFQLQLKY